MYQLTKKKILLTLLPSMVEAKNFSAHPHTTVRQIHHCAWGLCWK